MKQVKPKRGGVLDRNKVEDALFNKQTAGESAFKNFIPIAAATAYPGTYSGEGPVRLAKKIAWYQPRPGRNERFRPPSPAPKTHPANSKANVRAGEVLPECGMKKRLGSAKPSCQAVRVGAL